MCWLLQWKDRIMARRETKYDKALQAVIATFNERTQVHPIERERGQLTVEAIYLLISRSTC